MIPIPAVRILVCTVLLGILTLAAAPVTYAAPPTTVAKTVYAQVLKVVPLHRPITHCPLDAKPAHSQGLMAQLRWDFDNQCTQDQSATQSFMVTYTWDGRTYTEKLSYNPGKHIPLEVRYR
jgi:uncharacterized protein YcfJ